MTAPLDRREFERLRGQVEPHRIESGADVDALLLSDPDEYARKLRAYKELLGSSEPEAHVQSRGEPTTADDAWVMMGALLAEPELEHEWLVDGLLPDAGTSLLTAKPKVGKSTLAQNLAFSVARGEPFLGRPTKRGRVIYLALEERRNELRRHFCMMGATENDDIAFYVARAPEDALAWLEAEAAERKPDVIIVDTLQKFARFSDLNDYGEVTNKFDRLSHLARKVGAHLMFTHHAKKSGGSDGDAVLGSTGLFGAVDTLLEMRRRDDVRSLSSIQRYGEDLEPTIIALDPETYRLSAQGSTTEADQNRVEAAIVDHLEATSEAETRVEVFDAIEGRGAVKSKALKALVESGRALRTGEGRKNDPYRYARPVSCSPVPDICGDQENKKRQTGENPHDHAAFSCSRDFADSQDARNENPDAASESATDPEANQPVRADDTFAYANARIQADEGTSPRAPEELDL